MVRGFRRGVGKQGVRGMGRGTWKSEREEGDRVSVIWEDPKDRCRY